MLIKLKQGPSNFFFPETGAGLELASTEVFQFIDLRSCSDVL
jgi:hypothetical protein